MKRFLLGALMLLCSCIVPLSTFALPITGVANISSGEASASPAVVDGGITYTVTDNGRTLYGIDGELASTAVILPTLSAFGTGLTVLGEMVVQIHSSLTASDIFNASAGYLGVGFLDGVYGVIFENFTEEFSVSFETNTLPMPGRFLGLGTTGNGTPFTFIADDIPIPGSQVINRSVPEPASFALVLAGLVGIGAYRKQNNT